MRLGSGYWVLLSLSLVIISGTADAHPHELEEMNHGQSLERYQIEFNFTTGHSTKGRYNPKITVAEKNKIGSISKSDKRVRAIELGRSEKVKKDKDQKQKK